MNIIIDNNFGKNIFITIRFCPYSSSPVFIPLLLFEEAVMQVRVNLTHPQLGSGRS